MNVNDFEGAITSQIYPIDGAAFEQQWANDLAAFERGEQVASFHQAVGKIEVEPEVLAQVVAALDPTKEVEGTEPIGADFSGLADEDEPFLDIEDDVLRSFLVVAGRRLLDVVSQQPYRVPRLSNIMAEAGPYQYMTLKMPGTGIRRMFALVK